MIRWSTTAVVMLLALVAGVVSYRHAHELVTTYGESGFTGVLVPLTVDGLIYASSMVLLYAARRNVPAPRLARFTLGLGILATLAANVAHGAAHGVIGAIVAAWPAVALVLGYELLMWLIRSAAAVPEPGGAAHLTDVGKVDEPQDASANFAEASSAQPQLSDVPDPSGYVPEPLAEDLAAQAASRFLADVIMGNVPGVRTIKAEMNIGQDKAQAVRTYLATLAEQ